ncbi:MAG: HAD family hydrolase, partial [Nitrospinota bacterium]
MIKAIFFDLYNTILGFDPPREEIQALACGELGIEVDREAIKRAYPVADDFLARENSLSPVEKRPEEEQRRLYAQYERLLLREAGVEVSQETASQVFSQLRQLRRGFALFDDVLPTLSLLKGRGLLLGLISNLHRDLEGLCERLGLAPYFDFLLTAQEAGAEKPDPRIFLAALERAKVSPAEALHVGDGYYADVLGARGVGIKALLI